MVATASLLYRMGIEGGEKVRAEVSSVGTEEEKTAARAIAAADRKAERVAAVERQLQAVRAQSAEADTRALALITGNSQQYEAAKRREVSAERESNSERRRTIATVGQLRAGTVQLSANLGDITQQVALGVPYLTIFAQQGGQVVQAIQLMTNSTSGFLGFIAGPWGAVITGGVMILGMLVSKTLDSTAADEAKKKAAEELTKSLDSLYESTMRQVRGEEHFRAATLASAFALLTKAAAARQEAQANLDGAISRQRIAVENAAAAPTRFSPEGGMVAVAATQQAANAAKAERAKLQALLDERAAEETKAREAARAAQLIEANARVTASIDKTADANARYSATVDAISKRYLDGKSTLSEYEAEKRKLEVAHNTEIESLKKNKDGVDRNTQSLARQASAMDVNAAGSIALAKAYLEGGEAALKAEAARKGLTDATRRGIEGEAQVRRQLEVMIGEQLVNSAKSLAQMRDETGARKAVNDNVLAGTLAVENMSRALADEAALRPLLKLQATAQGEALVVLTRIIDGYRKALEAANGEEARANALKGIGDARARVAELRASILDLDKDPLTQAANAARRAAEREADRGNFSSADRTDFINARVEQARAEYAERRAQSYIRTKQDQEDALTLAGRELGLVNATERERQRELSLLQLSLQMKRDGLVETDADYQSIMRNAEAYAELTAELTRQHAAREEGLRALDRIVETTFDVRNLNDFGEAGKRILNEMIDLGWQLAVINPLKNWLTGSDLPGLAGVFAGLFGGSSIPGSAGGMNMSGWDGAIPGNAVGTESWRGGMMIAGENGREIISAPAGSKVIPAARTRALLNGSAAIPEISLNISIDATGADAAGLARVEAELRTLRQELPSTILGTVNEGIQRRLVGRN